MSATDHDRADDVTAAARHLLDGVDTPTDPVFGDLAAALDDWGMAVVPGDRVEALRQAVYNRDLLADLTEGG